MFTLALCINASSLANKSYCLIFSDSTVCSISWLVTPTSIRVISPFFLSYTNKSGLLFGSLISVYTLVSTLISNYFLYGVNSHSFTAFNLIVVA